MKTVNLGVLDSIVLQSEIICEVSCVNEAQWGQAATADYDDRGSKRKAWAETGERMEIRPDRELIRKQQWERV
jgi:hypothetical protein